MRKINRGILLWAVIFSSMFLAACGGSDEIEEEAPAVEVIEPETEEEAEPEPAPEEEAADEQAEEILLPEVTYETVREARLSDSGTELAYVSYPVFTVTGEGYEALAAAIASINEEWKAQSVVYLDTAEDDSRMYQESFGFSTVFGQSVYVDVTRCDAEVVSISVTRSVEEGGPHPNNYNSTYNLNAQTGESLRLSDVTTVDDALKEEVKRQLHENYLELEFDDAQMTQEISEALDNSAVDWYFWEGQICIVFKEGSFGFGHAEGSLGVVLPGSGV